MISILRIILAVILGLIVGSAVNMGLIMLGGRVIPPPSGADVATLDGLKASMHLLEARHYVFPFLAHALGTLAGAIVAGLLSPGGSRVPAYTVGGLFLLGGIANVVMLPAPAWFAVADLLLAYLPAAWLGQAIAMRMRRERTGGP